VASSSFEDSFKLGVPSLEIKRNRLIVAPLHWAYQCDESLRYGFSTNGLSGGFSKNGALIHSLEEISERHFFSSLVSNGHISKSSMRRLNLSTEDLELAYILSQLEEAQLVPVFMTSPQTLVPFVWCALFDHDPIAPFLQLTSGYSCGTSHRDAAIRALTEACQVRCSQIQGTREDFKDPPPSLDPVVVERIRLFTNSLREHQPADPYTPIDENIYSKMLVNSLPGRVYFIELESNVSDCFFCKVVAPSCAFNTILF
jgi:YcaO-like protein with predicted kinase domain